MLDPEVRSGGDWDLASEAARGPYLQNFGTPPFEAHRFRANHDEDHILSDLKVGVRTPNRQVLGWPGDFSACRQAVQGCR